MVNDGGPAYPAFVRERVYRGDADRVGHFESCPQGGMSLRDYFAGQALAGVLSNLSDMRTDARLNLSKFAADYYLMADAMLKAREMK